MVKFEDIIPFQIIAVLIALTLIVLPIHHPLIVLLLALFGAGCIQLLVQPLLFIRSREIADARERRLHRRENQLYILKSSLVIFAFPILYHSVAFLFF